MAARGDTRRLAALIDAGADVNARDEHDNAAPLHRAGAYGTAEAVELLLRRGAEVNAEWRGRWTALHYAAYHGNLAIAEVLLRGGADPNVPGTLPEPLPSARTASPITPLHVAVARRRVELARALLAAGADPEGCTKSGPGPGYPDRPLHLAVAERRGRIAELLIHAGADVNARGRHYETPLHRAAGVGCQRVAALLLASGAQLEAADRFGQTPLEVAARERKPLMVRWLLTRKARLTLHVAAFLDNATMVREAASGGGDVNAVGQNGETPLHWAAREGSACAAEALIRHGADMERPDRLHYCTPLCIAAHEGHVAVARVLLDHGADPNAREEIGEQCTPLHRAAAGIEPRMVGHLRMVSLLLHHGANIESRLQRTGSTPLHKAAYHGQCGTVRLLLERGADIEAGSTGGTPLLVAVKGSAWAQRDEQRGLEVARLLLDRGADPNARDAEGDTPLGLAEKRGSPAVAALLRRYGAIG